MIPFQNNDFISMLTAVKYTYRETAYSDYSLSPRPCYNLAFFLKGEAEIWIGEKRLICRENDVLFIPQNATYKAVWKSDPETVFHTVHFNFSPFCDPLKDTKIPVQIFSFSHFEKLYSRVEEIQLFQYEKGAKFYLALSAFFALLGDVFVILQGERIKETETPVSPAIHYLKNHFKEKISVQELAELCFLSPSRFFYLFKKQTGLSPVAYKNKIAVQEICKTLVSQPHKSIEALSEEFGFESAIYFRRMFKKYTGKTPSQYKKEETCL